MLKRKEMDTWAWEMIAMQSYNGFERLRAQKIRLTLVNA